MANVQAKITCFEDLQNFFRLQCLLNTTGNSFLREMFKKRWRSAQGSEWQNRPEDAQKYLHGFGKRLFKASKSIQKRYLEDGNINTWDLPLLIDAIKSFPTEVKETPNNFKLNSALDNLKQIRNQLAHAGNSEVTESEFKSKWAETSEILLDIGIPQKDLDSAKSLKLQGDEVQKPEKNIDEENTKEARRLKSVGNDFYKHSKFEESIKAYSDAILQPGIPMNDLAILYSNRSIAFLHLKDFQSAKEDAKGAVHLRPTWWRGYSRLANAYQSLNKYKEALKYNEIALGMEPMSVHVKDARDFCRYTIAKIEREEHKDPMHFVDTLEEIAANEGGLTAQNLKLGQQENYKLGLGVGICGEGHKYLHGMGVAQNFELAAKLYAKAAQKGNAEGIYNLALLTREGKGVKRNVQEGHQWLLKAAEQNPIVEMYPGSGFKIPNLGVMEAQHTIGLAYQTGVGVSIDYEEALKWYIKALENGCGVSGNNIAIMYADGSGVKKNIPLAFMFWKVSAHLGVVRAMENLANNYVDFGEVRTAQTWYTIAVSKGSVCLPLDRDKFLFDKFPLEGFSSENFLQDLNEELLESPLRHFLLPKECSWDSIKQLGNFSMSSVDSLSKQYKTKIVLSHRVDIKAMKSREQHSVEWQKNPGKLQPKAIFDLVGLKTITLKEMDQTKDHIYEGSVLKLTIIEDATMGKPSIGLIGQDGNGDVQRIFVYNFPQDKETQDKLGFGCQISIVNPYFRITIDRLPAIRIDDASLLFLHVTLTDKKQCRNCTKGKSTIVCRKCRRAYYCSKQCLNADAEEMQHELVCIKRL